MTNFWGIWYFMNLLLTIVDRMPRWAFQGRKEEFAKWIPWAMTTVINFAATEATILSTWLLSLDAVAILTGVATFYAMSAWRTPGWQCVNNLLQRPYHMSDFTKRPNTGIDYSDQDQWGIERDSQGWWVIRWKDFRTRSTGLYSC